MTTPNNSLIAALQRLSGREMLINTETSDEFIANVTRFATTTHAEAATHEIDSRANLAMIYGIDDGRQGNDRKPFVYQDGIAVIPVHGALINRFNSSWGFVTGYNFIRRQLNYVLDDDDVESFILDVNTPGGEAAGCFEMAREILSSRRVKPSLAMVDSVMASGGMAIGGSATRVYGIPSARIGSIGVYRQHISIEGALKDAGVKIEFAVAGEHKVDGQPYKDLPDSVLRDWTTDVNKTWDDFIALVAESRGMTPDAVRATQARVFRAEEALALGLINDVKTTSEAVPAFVAEMADSEAEEDDEMTDTKSKSEVTSGLTASDKQEIAGMIGTAVSGFMAAQNRATAIREHGKAKGQVALAAKIVANDAINEAAAIEMIDAAAAAAAPPKSVKKAGKAAKITAENDSGEDDPEDDEDQDGESDDDDAEDGAEAARTRRQKDSVNHLDRAMSGNKREKVGSGNGEDEGAGAGLSADAKATAALLSDYASHTGNDLRKKAA